MLPEPHGQPALNTIAAEFSDGERLNVRYDTGHTVSSGRVFTIRNKRVDFENYHHDDFSGFDITKEKPDDLKEIGNQDSLFCWVKQNNKGWLACDDGSMEKADFIHIDDTHGVPKLSLIHVKGAHSDAQGRKISVSAYEVVTAQAVKNLIWLDRQDLRVGLQASIRQANYFWRDGRAIKKDAFLKALKSLPASFETSVVIIQPHLARRTLAKVKKLTDGADRLRLDQLNTLLAGAARNCAGLGATFRVVCSD
jgi:hypothetical protein